MKRGLVRILFDRRQFDRTCVRWGAHAKGTYFRAVEERHPGEDSHTDEEQRADEREQARPGPARAKRGATRSRPVGSHGFTL